MTTAAAKVRYSPPDHDTYITVLSRMDPTSCFVPGLPQDRVLYMLACEEAIKAVPMNDPPKGAFNRERYVRERLADAIAVRDRWYRNNLPAEGRA